MGSTQGLHREESQRMQWMSSVTLWTLMMMLVMLIQMGQSNINIPDDYTISRQIRAPFNGMRGKRVVSDNENVDLGNFNRWMLKRAPFNGMRGKRDFEERSNEDFYSSQDDQLNFLPQYLAEKRARGAGSGFVGMRG